MVQALFCNQVDGILLEKEKKVPSLTMEFSGTHIVYNQEDGI